MPILRIRVTASDDVTRALIDRLQSLPDIERVEEIDDLMPHMDDEDSSSAGLSDLEGPGLHLIEIETTDEVVVDRARDLAEATAFDSGALLEFVDES